MRLVVIRLISDCRQTGSKPMLLHWQRVPTPVQRSGCADGASPASPSLRQQATEATEGVAGASGRPIFVSPFRPSPHGRLLAGEPLHELIARIPSINGQEESTLWQLPLPFRGAEGGRSGVRAGFGLPPRGDDWQPTAMSRDTIDPRSSLATAPHSSHGKGISLPSTTSWGRPARPG